MGRHLRFFFFTAALVGGCARGAEPGGDGSGNDATSSADEMVSMMDALPPLPETSLPDRVITLESGPRPDVTSSNEASADGPATTDAPAPGPDAIMCPSDRTLCGDFCVDTQTDPFHCGRCNMTCRSGMRCTAGMCSSGCAMGQTECGADCVDTQSDVANCGGCGMACMPGQACMMGRCTAPCTSPQVLCDGRCIDPRTNMMNCGACGRACTGNQFCEGGACRTDPCNSNSNCSSCTTTTGCGWCRTDSSCRSGTSSGPTRGTCASSAWRWAFLVSCI